VRVEALLEDDVELEVLTRPPEGAELSYVGVFHVERHQQTSLDVMAYPSAYVNWENAALDSNEDKPVLRALELLSKNCTDR
jgi:hypothetical protein